MTNEIIYIQDYALIVSDEQAKENDWGYIPFEGGQVKLIGKFFADDWRKVIGYRPLNHSAWILKGVLLLPEFGQEKKVEREAKEYAEIGSKIDLAYANGLFYGFTAGATSKWVQAEKIKAQIEILNEIRGGFNTDNRFYIDYKIEQLEQQLKELED